MMMAAPHGTCPTEDDLLDLLFAPSPDRAVREHAANCAQCEKALAHLRVRMAPWLGDAGTSRLSELHASIQRIIDAPVVHPPDAVTSTGSAAESETV